MSAEGAVETKTEGEEAVVEAGAEAGAEAEAEVLVVTDGVVVLDGTEAGNTQDVKRKKFRPLKSIRKILGIKKGRKKSGDDPALLSAKPVSKSTGALLQVVETEPEEDVSNKTLANRSMSADSVFSPANGQTEPLRKGDMAASADNLNSQNFQSELSAKLKSRRSEDGASSEDECLPRSPDTIVTMADVINEHSTQNGMKRHSEESLESVGDEPGIAMAADQLAQGEKHQARQGTSVPAEFVSTGDVDLDAIPASPTHLSNQAALHKLSVAPKLRKASSRTRGVGKSPSPTPDLPIMSDSPRTADSPEPPVTPADTEPPPKPPRTDLVGHQTESDEVVNTAATENEVIPPDAMSDAVPPDSTADTAESVPAQSVQSVEEVQMSPEPTAEPTADQLEPDAFVPTLTPTREEGPLLEEQVVEFCPPVEVEASVEMPVVASHEESVVNTDASSVEIVEGENGFDSLGKSPAEEPEQNDDGVMEDEAGGGEEEEEAGDSGASSSGAAGSADQATDEDTGEAIAQRLLAVVAQQERTGGGEEHGPGSPPPSDLPDQPTPASPEAEDQDLITPKSPTRGPPNPLGQQLVEEMKRKQSVKKQDSFEEEEPPPEEPEEAVQEKEETAAEMEVPPAEEQDPAVATPETNQEEEQHGMYEDSHNSLQEDTHGAVQQVEEEEKEEAEEKVEDEPQDDLEETRQETVSSEDEAPPVEEEPPEEEEPEKETEKQNGPVEDETTPSEDDLEEYEEVVAKPPDVPVHNKRLSVAETRQMFARADPPAPETEAVIRPKLKPVPPKVEPSPSSSQPTKPVPIVPKTETPKETIVVKKPSSTPVVPSPMSPTASAAPQLRSLADKPQPKKVFGAIKALEDQGDDKIPAWVRIAQKKQKEREGGKDEDAAAVGGKKVVVVEKTPPAASSSQPPPKSPARKPSTGAVPPKVLVVEKTGSVTARPSAPRPSVGPTKPFSRPAEPPTPVIIPATKAPEQPKPLNSPTKPAESKPAVSTSPPPTKSGDLMANNNKLNRTGQFLARQQKKNFILPKPEKCIVCSENVYQTEMVKSDGRFFHKKCQRCLVCKRTLDISSFMVIQEKIYCKQHGQELKLAQQAV
ncbi:cell surface glycoprotein 1-like isoform X8 [Branchiostoma floridae]|uniref:Cell surface glycoprotein 1-like isoform X8 n=1 Tax=Branchiostoma floridae TaxID=7739 RepID=A0A9J7MWI4_BRAFL|nr:cell surface glycoprotein 1-like isoform X8 [Branchiostoma floridae]